MNTQHEQTETIAQAMTCPTCNRATRPLHTSTEQFPGTVLAMKQDGTCLTCLRRHNGWKPGGARIKQARSEAPGMSAAATREMIRARRAARGVPTQGLAAIRLVNTGRIVCLPEEGGHIDR